jgi:hypothetical protein
VVRALVSQCLQVPVELEAEAEALVHAPADWRELEPAEDRLRAGESTAVIPLDAMAAVVGMAAVCEGGEGSLFGPGTTATM